MLSPNKLSSNQWVSKLNKCFSIYDNTLSLWHLNVHVAIPFQLSMTLEFLKYKCFEVFYSLDNSFSDYTSNYVFPITPILGILVGIVGAVVLMALLIAIIMKLRSSKSSHQTKFKNTDSPMLMERPSQDYNGKFGELKLFQM